MKSPIFDATNNRSRVSFGCETTNKSMSFINKLFNKKDQPIESYNDFWDWFKENERDFHQIIKQKGNITEDFFDKMAPKLNQLRDGYWYLAGMSDDHTAELIITPDGSIKNIVFVEEIIAAAPSLPNWKFTALKQPTDIDNIGINMAGYTFNSETLSFYANEHPNYPDKIDIVVTHNNYKEEDQSQLYNGTYIFLDNYLGELNSVTTIDHLTLIATKDATKELIPIAKLKSFLIWREKEFIEKYQGQRHNTDNDKFSSLKATLGNGLPLLAIVNTDLLNWDRKASHPWIATVEIKYNGENNNGLPEEETYQLLNDIEDEITAELKDSEGFLNVGRETADDLREIYYACVDFRKPSKVMDKVIRKYKNQLEMDFRIRKDKYWQSFNRYMQK